MNERAKIIEPMEVSEFFLLVKEQFVRKEAQAPVSGGAILDYFSATSHHGVKYSSNLKVATRVRE